ncbi:purple acid phosphatase family protein [Flammeovirga agarivorans]|uniref:Metallophosphoesterase family protein n=1 Tax=Flammeovirga agarivorans TaxID=2726742 RepID=A0A7X8SK03_9BACT|nr:metallophosphoesterase family protein [Flammeovirga agarivorans]NLR91665.1 metallophosphoesterase family protein [Flammeovirga agarivorans]
MKLCTLIFSLFLVVNVFGQHKHNHYKHRELHHWELPSKDPDRIVLTFNGNPATNRAVTWRTNEQIEKGYAQIALATMDLTFSKNAKQIEAKSRQFDLGLHTSNTPLIVHYHSVTFEDLEPDQYYVYRVGDGNENWSEWIQFKTAKKEYSPTQFVYFGDAQSNVLENWSRVVRTAYQTAPNASFAIHAGNFVDNAHNDNAWAKWFKAAGFIHSRWTTVPVVGSQEFESLYKNSPKQLSMLWKPQFTLPRETGISKRLHETVYSFDYQEVQIIVLNSNQQIEEQTKFLEEKLRSSQAKWNIVTFHHSIFSPTKREHFQLGNEQWQPILQKYNVDLVLNSHTQTYTRGHTPTNQDKELGTVYVTSVSGSEQNKLDTKKVKSFQANGYQLDQSGEQSQLFQVISIAGNTLKYVAYTVFGDEYDRMEITKDFSTNKKVIIESK